MGQSNYWQITISAIYMNSSLSASLVSFLEYYSLSVTGKDGKLSQTNLKKGMRKPTEVVPFLLVP